MLDGKPSGCAGDNGQASSSTGDYGQASGSIPETVRIRRALDDAFLEVPAVGLGTWSWGAAKWGWRTWDARLTRRGVLRAWDAFVDGGGGLVDTADDYGAGLSERLVGAGLARNATNVFFATKGGGRPSELVSAASASCERLGVDRVALYQLHSVCEPIERAADGLAAVAKAGLCDAVGACNHDVAQLERLRARLERRGVALGAAQVEGSLLSQDAFARDGVHDWCAARGVALLAYAPLASGRLARRVVDGELRPAMTEKAKRGFGRADDAKLKPLLRRLGDAPAAAALRWLTAHGGVVAIPGCKTADQVVATVAAARAFGPPADGDALAAAGRAAAGRPRPAARKRRG